MKPGNGSGYYVRGRGGSGRGRGGYHTQGRNEYPPYRASYFGGQNSYWIQEERPRFQYGGHYQNNSRHHNQNYYQRPGQYQGAREIGGAQSYPSTSHGGSRDMTTGGNVYHHESRQLKKWTGGERHNASESKHD